MRWLSSLSRGNNYLLLVAVRCSSFDIAKTSFLKNTGTKDLLRRELDCAVIQALHQSMKKTNQKPFDSVRGLFWEGDQLYPQAGFKEKDHIQICIRNIDCIKGYFLPLPRVNS